MSLVSCVQVLFDPGYDTHSLLVNFLYCYKGRPHKSRNGVLEGTVSRFNCSFSVFFNLHF